MKDLESTLGQLILNDGTFELLKLIVQMNAHKSEKLSFNQSELIYSFEFQKFETLQSVVVRFNGLCELISNCVIANDLLGSHSQLNSFLSQNKSLLSVRWSNDTTIQLIFKALQTEALNPYEKYLTLTEVDRFSKSHTLDVYSHFQKMIAYFVDVFPFDLFSAGEKVQIGKTVNQSVLEKKLESLDDGSYIKFMTFTKGVLSFQGHSMVIKKTGNTFSFFDPNKGEMLNLKPTDLCQQINHSMKEWNATHMAFIDGIKHIQSLDIESNEDKSAADIELKHTHDEGITRFILTELNNIIAQKNLDDYELVKAMDHLRDGVEQFTKQKSILVTPTENRQVINSVLDPYVERQVHRRLRELDDLRIRLKKESWVEAQSVDPIIDKTLENFVITPIACLDDIIAPLINTTGEEFEKLLQTVSLPSLIQSPYELAALFDILDKDKIKLICEALQEHLFKMMPSSRLACIILRTLRHEENASIVYNAIRPSLASLVTSVTDFSNITTYLPKDDKHSFYESIKEKLPKLIQSANDIVNILDSLPEQDRVDFYENIAEELPQFIQSVYDYAAVQACLSSEQGTKLHESMSKTLLSWVTSANNLSKILKPLTLEQRERMVQTLDDESLTKVMQSALDLSYVSNLGTILSGLSPDQCVKFCQNMGDALPKLIKQSSYRVWDVLKELSTEKQAIFNEAIQASLPVFIQLSQYMGLDELPRILTLLQPEQGTLFCAKMKKRLDMLFQDFFEVTNLLRDLSPEQCEMVCDLMKKELSDIATKHKGLLNQIPYPKRAIVYVALNERLVDVIDTADELLQLLRECTEKQRVIVLDAMQHQLPSMMKSVNDLGSVLEYLTPAQTTVMCNAVKNKLPSMIKSEQDVEFLKSTNLSPEQYTIICVAMGKLGQKWITPLLEHSFRKPAIHHESNDYKAKLSECRNEDDPTVGVVKNIK